MNFRFEHTGYLLALALVPVCVWLFVSVLRWKKKTLSKIGDEKLVKQLIRNYSRRKFLIKFIIVLTGFGITALAAANFQTPGGGEQIKRQGIDVMIALDVSKSMLAEDIKPSRLEKAKLLVNKLIDKLQNDQVGIALFAGRAYMQMPLTSDHAVAKIYVQSASTESVPTQGTVIGDAIEMCNSAFSKKEKKYKSIILISDGEDHDDRALALSKQMAEAGVLINTVGVGSIQGTTLIDPVTREMKRDEKGNPVVSKLNQNILQELTAASKGEYLLLTDTDEAAARLQSQLDKMEQKSISDANMANFKSHFQWFLGVALFLLALDLFIAEKNIYERPLKKLANA